MPKPAAPATREPESKRLFRTAAIDRAALKDDTRELPLAFASEEPVERWDWRTGKTYFEILDHSSEKSADLSRLNGSGQLLLEHDRRQKLGGVVKGSAKVDADKKSRAIVKFSRSALAEQEYQDIKDGIPRNVSFGYETLGMLKSEVRDGVEYRTYAWCAYEISLVTIEADTTVGIGRAHEAAPPVDDPALPDVETIAEKLTAEQRMKLSTILRAPAETPVSTPAPDESKIRSTAISELRKRAAAIKKSCDEFIKDHGAKNGGKLAEELRAFADECLYGRKADGTEVEVRSIEDFQRQAMEKILKAEPVKPVTMRTLGFDEREARSYSLVRAIQDCIQRDDTIPHPDTVEGEAHLRMKKLNMPFGTKGFLVPADAQVNPRSLSLGERARFQRDLIATNFGTGGALVPTDFTPTVIDVLRNKMVTAQLGITILAGLSGNVVLPRQTATATAYSVAETAALTLSTQALDQVALTPHRVGAWNNYSKQLLLQSAIDVENFVRNDLMQVIALDWDRLLLNGQGANAEPLGVMNTPGIGFIHFGAAATFAKLVAMETAIAIMNAPAEGRAYVTTSGAKGVLKSAAKLLTGATTVAATALWENDMINGYRAIDSQQIPNNQMLFGAWPNLIHGIYGGLDVVIDPYTLATQAEVRIVMNTWGDCLLRYPQVFCVSDDSAAQ